MSGGAESSVPTALYSAPEHEGAGVDRTGHSVFQARRSGAVSWRSRHTAALTFGAILAGLDIVYYACLANGSLSVALSLSVRTEAALSRFFAYLNGPVIRLIAAPYLGHLIPADGGGWLRFWAMVAYALVCALQAFLVGFVVGELYSRFRSRGATAYGR